MEPGHEDREYVGQSRRPGHAHPASMEPGHEDREYLTITPDQDHWTEASMEPGHEDREYRRAGRAGRVPDQRLNGARS